MLKGFLQEGKEGAVEKANPTRKGKYIEIHEDQSLKSASNKRFVKATVVNNTKLKNTHENVKYDIKNTKCREGE